MSKDHDDLTGLRFPDLMALAAVAAYPGRTYEWLARGLSVRRGPLRRKKVGGRRLRRALAELERRGLAEQGPSDEGSAWSATRRGAKLIREWMVEAELEDFEPDQLAGLEAWERKRPFPPSRGP